MIARALLHNPSILLLDEPFSGLDASAKQFVIERIAQEQDKGKGILITTHNTDLGYQIGTRFHFMIDGVLEESKRKEDNCGRSVNTEVSGKIDRNRFKMR